MSEGNGNHVTRAELAAHIQRIDENLERFAKSLAIIEFKVSDSPARKWIGARGNSAIDGLLPGLLIAALTLLGFHFL